MHISERKKYKRTYHLDCSPGLQSDDKLIPDNEFAFFEGKEVVLTEKMDGENTSLYPSSMHARSIDSKHNFTRDWVKKLHATLCHDIPDGWRLVGENMWGAHSIAYPDGALEGYFYLFAIYDEKDTLLSYDDILMYADILDLPMPQELYRGPMDMKRIQKVLDSIDTNVMEGAVLRVTKAVEDDSGLFHKGLAKWVREGHVQEDSEHWLRNVQQNGKLASRVRPFFMA